MALGAEEVLFWAWDAATAESVEFWGRRGENTSVPVWFSGRWPWPSLLSAISDNGLSWAWPSLTN